MSERKTFVLAEFDAPGAGPASFNQPAKHIDGAPISLTVIWDDFGAGATFTVRTGNNKNTPDGVALALDDTAASGMVPLSSISIGGASGSAHYKIVNPGKWLQLLVVTSGTTAAGDRIKAVASVEVDHG